METTTRSLLTLSQAARLFGLPVRWLRDEANAGRVPCLNAGRSLLFERDTLQAVLAERAGGAPALSMRGIELAIGGLLLQHDLPDLAFWDFGEFLQKYPHVGDLDAAFALGRTLLVFRAGRMVGGGLISPEERDLALGGSTDTASVVINVAAMVQHLRARLTEAGGARVR